MSTRITGSIAAVLILVSLLIACRARNPPVKVVGPLSSNDVATIEDMVRSYNLKFFGSMEGHPIKSIEVLSNSTVEVWFAAKEFRGGEGGNILQKQTNGWWVTKELYR
jgi:hypothetical protein